MKTPNTELYIPHIDSPVMKAVGAFIFAWGIVERELDTAFPVLFHANPTLASCIYANLGTKAKIDMLLSAVDMQRGKLNRLAEEAQKLLAEISTLSDRARTTLAHGQPLVFGGAPLAPRWEMVRLVARASHKIVIHPRNARYWETQSNIALRLAQRWRKKTAKIHVKVGHLMAAELETLCKTQIQVSAPSPARRRKHHSPRRHVFAGRPASLAKWPRTDLVD